MLPDRKERDEQRQQLQEAAEAVAAKEMDNGVRINPLLAAMHAAKRAEPWAAGDTELHINIYFAFCIAFIFAFHNTF